MLQILLNAEEKNSEKSGINKGNTMADKTLKIKLIKSTINAQAKHKKIIYSLGFKKLNQVIERPDNPCIRGMIFKVKHLVEVNGD